MPSHRIPRYRLHKPSGQAIIKFGGKVHYLGQWNSPESKTKFEALRAQWFAHKAAGKRHAEPAPTIDELTILELVDLYFDHADFYYRKAGTPTSEIANLKGSVRPLLVLFADELARDFGPLKLEKVRELLINGYIDRHGKPRGPLTREVVNSRVNRIRRVFRWGVSRQLVPPTMAASLESLDALKADRCDCRESKPVRPADDADIEATLPHLPAVVADMVRIQLLTGCRPGELCIMRPEEINRQADPWEYRPATHKTAHHGRERVIFIGPQARKILEHYLLRDAASFCFSPAESERKRREARHEQRQTPLSYGNHPGTNRKARPARPPRHCYTECSYRRAVQRACDTADKAAHEANQDVDAGTRIVARWSPNQLRHAAATEIRKLGGVEAAQVVLGHSRADVTQIYAERDQAKAAEIMKQIG
jgi:integrase